MSRYIDADALKKRMLDYFSPPEAFDVADLRPSWAIQDGIEDIFATFPTADVAPVVHGEWIMLNPSFAKCSVCGGYESTKGKDLTMKGIIFKEMKRYCPHCGARMDLQ